MTDDYRPPLADYFDELEQKHGGEVNFEKLSLEELDELERLARHAIEQDPKVSQVEKVNLKPLLTLLELQRNKRRPTAN
ncbi:MAG: hypothetical protein P8079_11535 [Gammaproteobacteria bacterium]|jgi:hypothetical protein